MRNSENALNGAYGYLKGKSVIRAGYLAISLVAFVSVGGIASGQATDDQYDALLNSTRPLPLPPGQKEPVDHRIQNNGALTITQLRKLAASGQLKPAEADRYIKYLLRRSAAQHNSHAAGTPAEQTDDAFESRIRNMQLQQSRQSMTAPGPKAPGTLRPLIAIVAKRTVHSAVVSRDPFGGEAEASQHISSSGHDISGRGTGLDSGVSADELSPRSGIPGMLKLSSPMTKPVTARPYPGGSVLETPIERMQRNLRVQRSVAIAPIAPGGPASVTHTGGSPGAPSYLTAADTGLYGSPVHTGKGTAQAASAGWWAFRRRSSRQLTMPEGLLERRLPQAAWFDETSGRKSRLLSRRVRLKMLLMRHGGTTRVRGTVPRLAIKARNLKLLDRGSRP